MVCRTLAGISREIDIDRQPRALEEEVRRLGLRRQEAQIQVIRDADGPACRSKDASRKRSSSRRKHGDVADRERPDQPLADGFEHVVEIGFRAQLAGELDQRPPVIVAVPVEV